MSGRSDFAEFYAAAFGPLTVQLHAFTGDHAEAQDLVQEAFCRAFARWSTISAYDDPTAWVRRVAWNLAVSRWRRGVTFRRFRRELAQPDIPAPSAAHVDLARALSRLPENHRRVIVLHYLADLPIAEISAFTSTPEGTVKVWLHRGRTALNTMLTSADEEVADV